jgi:hypothetical protein
MARNTTRSAAKTVTVAKKMVTLRGSLLRIGRTPSTVAAVFRGFFATSVPAGAREIGRGALPPLNSVPFRRWPGLHVVPGTSTERVLRRPGPAENAGPSMPQLVIRSGRMLIQAGSQPSPNPSPPSSWSFARPRTSSPRGVQGCTLSRWSTTKATRGLACKSRHFFDLPNAPPPISIVFASGSRRKPTGTT